jgi:osmotically-inducible protein OsmY
MNTPFRTALVAALVVLAGALLTACDKAQMDQAKADVKQAAKEVKQDVKDATAKAGPVMADSAITASIQTDFLKDPDLSVLKIDVDTKDGVVTLNGTAGNSDARSRAAKLASAIKGVKEVKNNLTVKQG